MFDKLKRYGVAAALVAGTFAVTTSAEARHGDGGEKAAIAIGAGIVGLAIGAMIADRDDRYYYDRSYYGHRRYVRVHGYPDYYYYYDGYPNRYYRDRYYSRYYGRHYGNRWDRGYRYNRWNRGYDRYDGRYRGDRWDRRHDRYHRRDDRDHRRWHRRHD